jgi:hypothetical protein
MQCRGFRLGHKAVPHVISLPKSRRAFNRTFYLIRYTTASDIMSEAAGSQSPRPPSSSPAPTILNKHAPTPVEQQRLQLQRLLKDPGKSAHIPKPPAEKTLRPPREMMKNVQGSSAGAPLFRPPCDFGCAHDFVNIILPLSIHFFCAYILAHD